MTIFECVVLIHFEEFCKSILASRQELELLYSSHNFVCHTAASPCRKSFRRLVVLYVDLVCVKFDVRSSLIADCVAEKICDAGWESLNSGV